MGDTSAAQEAYQTKIISNVALIRSEVNYADSLTNIKSNGAHQKLLRSHMVQHYLRQWVMAPPVLPLRKHKLSSDKRIAGV